MVANAGVGRGSGDPLMQLEGTSYLLPTATIDMVDVLTCSLDPFSTPTKPSMHIVDINLVGAIYTFKLATHYFRRCPQDAQRDRCFIFIGSVAGILDNLVRLYSCSVDD